MKAPPARTGGGATAGEVVTATVTDELVTVAAPSRLSIYETPHPHCQVCRVQGRCICRRAESRCLDHGTTLEHVASWPYPRPATGPAWRVDPWPPSAVESHRAAGCVTCSPPRGGAQSAAAVTATPEPAPAPDRPAAARTVPARPRSEPAPAEPVTPLSIPDVASFDLAEAAQAYAAAGWYVVPVDLTDLRNAGSVLGAGWPGKTRNDPTTVARWFGDRGGEVWLRAHGRLGIALHVGRSGAVAFDVDHPEHVPAVLAEAIEATRPPFQSSRVDVPGRGAYVFTLPPGLVLGNSAGSLGKGWGEVKGTNGTVHVAPTEHHKAAEGGWYTWVRTGRVPVLTKPLGAALLAGRDHPSPAGAGTRQAAGNVRARVLGLLDKLGRAEPGERNRLLFWTACRFGQLVGAGALPEATAVDLLTRAGDRLDLESHQVAATVASGIRTGSWTVVP